VPLALLLLPLLLPLLLTLLLKLLPLLLLLRPVPRTLPLLPLLLLCPVPLALLLPHLLVAPLHAAVALVEVHHVAVCVCNDLDLDVARLLHILLHKHAAVTKRGLGLVGGAVEQVNHLKVCGLETIGQQVA
jgi:hypothetical protein